ncbi:MAG TPA: Nif3-like dinuclear metal center hexameric protein [Methanolinea sp.]|nr:Nif3-like dinuclear metal center hexameric protein [Methanolinea sp.]HQK54952.1 Nif3-like dinuclear metal center hexameric protein [Methanolinea sp.]
MEIGEFVRIMEALAPPELAEEWDSEKIGLVVEGTPEIEQICCALDATPETVGQAVSQRADMLVVHHTPIWTPVTAFRGPLASLLRKAISAGLNIYVMHTNYDHAPGGVNDVLANLLGLANISPLSIGLVGECGIGIQEIADRLNSPLRAWNSPHLPGTLAVVGGSGFSPELIREAADEGAGSFLSAELRHSVARSSPIPLLEATHYALEAPAMRSLAERMGWTYIDDIPQLQIWTPKTSGNC